MDADAPFLLTAALNDHDDDCACPDKAFALTFDRVVSEVESDCACPDKAFTLNYGFGDGALFEQTPHTHTAELPYGFRLAFSPYAPAGPSVLSPAGWGRWQSFNFPQPLGAEIDRVLVEQRLIHPAGRLPVPLSAQPETLTAWLHVTNACNLDCPYCYVRKSSARMNDAIGLQALEAVFRSAQVNGFRIVKLKYAGGESTLHFKLIRRLHNRARELAAETGLQLKEVVLSNGVYLRPEDADWLAEEKVKLMVSVDGVGEMHNRLRPQVSGGDTFSRVESTIDRVLFPRGVRPDITMTVTRLNALGAAEVTRWALIERGLPLSFNFYRQNALSTTRTELVLEETTIIEGMLAAYEAIAAHLPAQPFFNGLLDRVQAEAHSHTCGVGQSYVVITHTGQLAQCQMHLDKPVNPNLDGDLLPLVSAGPLRNISVDEKDGCRSCEFRYRCSGGCPLETYRATGRWDVQSPNCRIYKQLLPQALLLEGLRLMKVNGYLS
jgi:uncharacterized protein